jgi:serine/threonine protein kinase
MNQLSRSSCFTFSDREMPVRFGRYNLLARIAIDPVGEDFLAAWGVDEGIDQLRVVRCVYPLIAEETEFVALFSEEARSLSRLLSTNVVRIMEVGIEGKIPFVAREHVEGLNLEQLIMLAQGRTALWPWELAAHVTTEILRGLDYVHRREDLHGNPMGMRHGDIRPSNVLVSVNGEVKLANFGSTLRFIADEKTNARLSDIRGRFFPPEGIDEVDPTVGADLWGVGLIFVMLLGGRTPSKQSGEHDVPWMPPQMSFRVESLPDVVDTFIGQALNPDPSFRFSTARDMRAALLEVMQAHAKGHPPDDLAEWVKELAQTERRSEEELVRRLLGKEAQIHLDETAGGTGALAVGHVLDGRYHLLRRLGEGGMGVVFEADHLGLRRKVAVKVLHDRVLDDENTVERFRREAQIIGSLGHPNIVGALDFGITSEGYHYLAMDLLEGNSLAELIEGGSLSPRELTTIMAEVCDGLQAAHDANVIHRDLKPDNVFLTPTGARILDFGIAKSTGLDKESEALTRTGHICGTVDYIAPEQIRGLSQDPRSDIYAAGVIIYEALTKTTPFKGRTVGETLHKVMNDKLVSPRKRSGDKTIPADLEAICIKALSRRADKRFFSAAKMASALRALLPPPGETADIMDLGSESWIRRSWKLGGIAVAALAIGAAAWFVSRGHPDNGESLARIGVEAKSGEDRGQASVDTSGEAVVVIPPDAGTKPASRIFVSSKDEAKESGSGEKDDARALARDKVRAGESALAKMSISGAVHFFEEAVQLDSRNSRAWYGLGKAAFQRGDYSVAVDKTEQALRLSPANVSRRIFLGKIFLAAGQKADAAAQFRRVLATHPGNEKAAKLLKKVDSK